MGEPSDEEREQREAISKRFANLQLIRSLRCDEYPACKCSCSEVCDGFLFRHDEQTRQTIDNLRHALNERDEQIAELNRRVEALQNECDEWQAAAEAALCMLRAARVMVEKED